jgi:hypothetical protein
MKLDTKMSMALIPIKGMIIPPRPYINRFLLNSAFAPIGLYGTPFRASGINNGIMMALKMTAERIALSGLLQLHDV